jgi:hypothetical protein
MSWIKFVSREEKGEHAIAASSGEDPTFSTENLLIA